MAQIREVNIPFGQIDIPDWVRPLLPDQVAIRTDILPPFKVDVNEVLSGKKKPSPFTKLLFSVIHPRIGFIKDERAFEYDPSTGRFTEVHPSVYERIPEATGYISAFGFLLLIFMIYGGYALIRDAFFKRK